MAAPTTQYYKCPDCDFAHPNWLILKSHMTGKHDYDLQDATQRSDFQKYEIPAEDYVQLRQKKMGNQPPATPPVTPATPALPAQPAQPTPVSPPIATTNTLDQISEYVGEPVARLRQVLLVNGGSPPIVETITKVMTLSRWLWGNPYELERTLLPHFPGKRDWVQACISQYIRGVELPDDIKGLTPYTYGQPNAYGQTGYTYPYGAGQPTAPALPNPELLEVRAELNRLREERQKEHEQRLLDRIAELEKKAEGGGPGGYLATLEAKIKELENRLTGGSATMTILDDRGNPMVLPYDRSYMAALNRKAEVETDAIKTTQMIELFKGRGDGSDKYTLILESLKKEQEAANKRVEDLTKALNDQRIAHLEERIKAAEEMAGSMGGEGKGVLDLASEAGSDIKEGVQFAAEKLKETISEGFDKASSIMANRPAPVTIVNPRTPEKIADIIDAENEFLSAIGEK